MQNLTLKYGNAEETLDAISEVLPKQTNLRGISVTHFGLGNKNIKKFMQAVSKLPNLKSLDINHNKISFMGSGAIAGFLKKNESLETFILGETKIGFWGYWWIARGLKNNNSLKKITLNPHKYKHVFISFFITMPPMIFAITQKFKSTVNKDKSSKVPNFVNDLAQFPVTPIIRIGRKKGIEVELIGGIMENLPDRLS